MTENPRSRRWKVALTIAIAADLLQLALFPSFIEGILSPLNDLLDVLVSVVLILLVGWHMAFLPALVMEQLPLVDLAPTWTLAVLVAGRANHLRHRADIQPTRSLPNSP